MLFNMEVFYGPGFSKANAYNSVVPPQTQNNDLLRIMSLEEHIDIAKTLFEAPTKRIFDSQGTYDFQSSVAIARLKYHLQKYVVLVNREQIPQEESTLPLVNKMTHLLSKLSNLVDETPPLVGPRRYGNLACRDWHAKVDANLSTLLEEFLPKNDWPCIIELKYYLANSFGSSTRLDYGTGHELSFLAVISAIDMLSLWTDNFSGRDVLLIFDAYYKLVRKLILTYTLEPAGSHGVWGLDDHFHLAYILGSSQWSSDPKTPITPRDITNKELTHDYAETNLYCQAIDFIYRVKSGPFSEHSSMLYDIATTVRTWSKVQSGLIKMYSVEVLNKFPVVQHFWFGTGFYPWKDFKTGKELPVYENSPEAEIEGESSSKDSLTPTLTNMAPTTANMYHFPQSRPRSNPASKCVPPMMHTTAVSGSKRSNMGPPTTRMIPSRSKMSSPQTRDKFER